jgi:hypothetical protein
VLAFWDKAGKAKLIIDPIKMTSKRILSISSRGLGLLPPDDPTQDFLRGRRLHCIMHQTIRDVYHHVLVISIFTSPVFETCIVMPR